MLLFSSFHHIKFLYLFASSQKAVSALRGFCFKAQLSFSQKKLVSLQNKGKKFCGKIEEIGKN
jgi:hypothetical protein